MCGRTRRTDVKLVGVQLSLCLLCFSGVPLRVGSAGSTVEVKEGSDAILPCSLSTKEDIRPKTFDWRKDGQKDVFLYSDGSHYNNGLPGQDEQFRGRVSHFPDELQHGNASITINKTKLADSGKYTCDFPNLQPPQTSHIELVVAGILKDRSENLPGAAPEPSVTGLDQKQDRVLLQCEVQGASPEPKVEWKDSSGNILPAEEPLVSERGGSFYITLTTTVTKTDTYRCVATQKEINHQIEAETYVYIKLNSGAEPGSGYTSGWPVAGFVIILLIVVAVLQAVLYIKGYIILNFNRGSTSASQPAAGDEVALNGSSSKEATEP